MGLPNQGGRQLRELSWGKPFTLEMASESSSSSRNDLCRPCDVTSTALQQTLSHKKKPTLVPAPFTHRGIGRSASSSVMFGFMPAFSCYLFEMVWRELKSIAV